MAKTCGESPSENIKLRILEDRLRRDLAPKDMLLLADFDGVLDKNNQFYTFIDGELKHITWGNLKSNLDLNKAGSVQGITIEDGYWKIGDELTGVKAEGSVGPQGERGAAGADGTSIRQGDTVPGIEIGIENDLYLDSNSWNLYKKSADSWELVGNIKGEKGEDGKDGLTPHIDKDTGHWFIGDVDTEIKAQGPKGDTGAHGDSPYIGENDHWWIGTEDTGRSAIGPTGPKGDPGYTPTIAIGDNDYWYINGQNTGISAKGEKGEQGLQGDTGLTGAVGPAGAQGPKGDKGDKGEPGKDGQNGAAGVDGQDGITPHVGPNGNWFLGAEDTHTAARGLKGDVGPKGDTGAQGIPGEQGPQGIPGKDGCDGKDGKDGKDAQLDISPDGKWVINGVTTSTDARGPKGDAGSVAAVKSDGSDIGNVVTSMSLDPETKDITYHRNLVAATTSDLNNYVAKSKVGTANGIAQLDAAGKVPANQLPSYVDDIVTLLSNEVVFKNKVNTDIMSARQLVTEISKVWTDIDSSQIIINEHNFKNYVFIAFEYIEHSTYLDGIESFIFDIEQISADKFRLHEQALDNSSFANAIFVSQKDNKTYRLGDAVPYIVSGKLPILTDIFVEISQSLALGETSTTAYAGDKGKKNAEDINSLANELANTNQAVSNVTSAVATKQDILVSGQNIATINNQDITKGGNITIEGSGGEATPEQIQQIEINKNDIANLKTDKLNISSLSTINGERLDTGLDIKITGGEGGGTILSNNQIDDINSIPSLKDRFTPIDGIENISLVSGQWTSTGDGNIITQNAPTRARTTKGIYLAKDSTITFKNPDINLVSILWKREDGKVDGSGAVNNYIVKKDGTYFMSVRGNPEKSSQLTREEIKQFQDNLIVVNKNSLSSSFKDIEKAALKDKGKYDRGYNQGGLHYATGEFSPSSNRLSYKYPIAIENLISITAGPDWEFRTMFYDENMRFLSFLEYTRNNTLLPEKILEIQPKTKFVNISMQRHDGNFIYAQYADTYDVTTIALQTMSDVKQFADRNIITSNNLFDYRQALNETILNTGTGDIQYNSNHWTTGLIEIPDGTEKIYVSLDFVSYLLCYDANKKLLGPSKHQYNPFELKPGTKYVNMYFAKSKVAYEMANTISVITDTASRNLHTYYQYNPQEIEMKELGYIEKSDLLKFTNSIDKKTGAFLFNKSFSFNIPRCSKSFMNTIIECRTRYEGIEAPKIQFAFINRLETIENPNKSYWFWKSIVYEMGTNEGYSRNSWRIPPFPRDNMNLTVIITIPAGTTLYMDGFHNIYSNSVSRFSNGLRINAHTGYRAYTNGSGESPTAVELASQLGFEACIVIPKATKDHKYVCFHDDAKVGTNLTDKDGNFLSSELQAKKISDFTYDELMQYYVGQSNQAGTHNMNDGEHILSLDKFFSICARTGMHPMFSIHPLLPESDWIAIKELAKKHNVLKNLTLKTGQDAKAFALLHKIFGDEVEGYEIDASADSDCIDFANQNIGSFKTQKAIEYFDTDITEEKVKAAIAAGYRVSVALMKPIKALDGKFIKQITDWGVTEYTDDYNCSSGLLW